MSMLPTSRDQYCVLTHISCRLHLKKLEDSHLQHKRLFWCGSVAVDYGCQSAGEVVAAVKSLFGLAIRSCWAIKKSTCMGKQLGMCLWLMYWLNNHVKEFSTKLCQQGYNGPCQSVTGVGVSSYFHESTQTLAGQHLTWEQHSTTFQPTNFLQNLKKSVLDILH